MLNVDKTIAVVGLGYVGLPVAVAFAQKFKVIGFDIDEDRIKQLKQNYDQTCEVAEQALLDTTIHFTTKKDVLKQADVIIVAVPTPIDDHNTPDLTPLIHASKMIGEILQPGMIIVYESTVYPGATEEVCIPILEQQSNLKYNESFYVGYSPERINPGDKQHTFDTVKKVVSSNNPDIGKKLAQLYEQVVTAGVYVAPAIKVAEAAKVIENTQRDINIALINELAVICKEMHIDTVEVLKAAKTKWNFLPFSPGLVGGHCIGVDPYYLTYKAQTIGYYPEVILAGRRINSNMAKYIVAQLVKLMIQRNIPVHGATVNIFGITFKENCPDLRNSQVFTIIKELKAYNMTLQIHDPVADKTLALSLCDIELLTETVMTPADIAVFAVGHDIYIDNKANYLELVKPTGIVCDIKSIFDVKDILKTQYLWRL